MHNIKLTIAYDGTRYSGWQIQKNAKTIQDVIEGALRKILSEKVKLIAAGRTDAGVHAKAQVANFRTKREFPLDKLQKALNSNLPDDISIIKIGLAGPRFHSRFDARAKLYRYTILNSRVDDPFGRNYYSKVLYNLNIALMKREAKVLAGKHDFKSFQAKSALSRVKNTTRTIKKITVRKDKDLVYIDIEANGFLHNMVRNIAGTLVEIGRGNLHKGSMNKILASRDRRKAGPTAPAKGLTLVKVKY